MVSNRVEGTGFLSDHFHNFSAGPGGRARTGSPSRKAPRSSASSPAVG